MTKLISGRVKKIPSANVSASRYDFIKLSETEPDLGLPAANGYVLSGNVDGRRAWILPSTAAATANTVLSISNFTTANLAEGTNLYFTNARVYANVISLLPTYTGNLSAGNIITSGGAGIISGAQLISTNVITANIWNGLYTSNVIESAGNLYFTNARSYANLTAASINALADVDTVSIAPQVGYGLTWNGTNWVPNVVTVSATELANVANTVLGIVQSSLVANTAFFASNANIANIALTANIANTVLTLSNFTTSNLIEGANLYFTNTRVIASLLDANLVLNNATINGTFTPTLVTNGNVSAYATKYIVEYNPTSKQLTYSSTPDASNPYITGYSSEIHVSPVAFNDSGKGTIGDPVKTIARAKALAALAFETTAAGSRKTIVLHPGDYPENVTIDTQYTVLTTHELIGKNTTLSGTLTLATGCTIDGLKITNLVISGTSATGSIDIIGCTVTTATTKTSTAYTNFRGCDLSTSSLSITGAGTTILVGGNYYTLTVNNASAVIMAKAVISMGAVTLTAGTLQLSDTLIYALTPTANAITQSAGSVITLNNCQTLLPTLDNVARNSFGGFYSILHSVYDKTNSTFGGTSLNAISYSQYINADSLTINGGGFITGANLITSNIITSRIWNGLYTANVIETSGNLYFTNARVYANVSERLLNLNSNIIPAQDEVYNLGSPERKFKDLYLSGFTLSLGTTTLSAGQDNSLSVTALVTNNVTSNIWTNLYTANVIESASNLYFTNARVYANIAPLLTTANVSEVGNLYFTNARVFANVVSLLPTYTGNLSAGNIITSGGAGIISGAQLISTNVITANVWNGLYTANVLETLGNLYFTNARASANVIGLLPSLAGNNISIAANGQISAVVSVGSLGTIYTSNIIENGNTTTGNVYFSNARARAAISPADGSIVYDPVTGLIRATGEVVANITATVSSLTTANIAESPSNLYYTNARVLAGLVNSNLIVNDALILGNLVVQGDFVTLNTATLIVEDKNIVLANGAVNSGAADGAGFSIDGAQANLKYRNTGDKFEFNKALDVLGTLTAATVSANIWNGLYTANVFETQSNLYYTNARVYANVIGLLNAKANVVDLTTANVLETSGNLYFTNVRTSSNIIGLLPSLAGDNITIAANGRISAITSAGTITGLNTANVNEFGNLYYTNARVYANISPLLTTANILEVGSNIYYTNARVYANVISLLPTYTGNIAAGNIRANSIVTNTIIINGVEISNTQIGANITINSITANIWNGLYTANVLETSGNLYYTNSRVYSNVIAALPTYNGNLNIGNLSLGTGSGGSITGANLISANIITATIWTGLYTSNIIENGNTNTGNVYFTNTRVISLLTTYTGNINGGNLSLGTGSGGSLTGANLISTNVIIATIWTGLYTANVIESASNLYFTNTRVYANVITLLPTLAGNNIIIEANGRISANLSGVSFGSIAATSVTGLTTANVNEVGNLYFTNARVYANVISLLPTYTGNLSAGNIITLGGIIANSLTINGNEIFTNEAGANLSVNKISSNIWNGLYTANVIETSGNLYYTNARVYANVIGLLNAKANVTDLTTANVSESASNFYYTNARAILTVIPAITELLVTTPGMYYSIDQYTGNNPSIDVRAGETIAFSLNAPGHPFMIRITASGSNYDTGLTHVATDGTISTGSSAQGKVSGKLFWKIPYSLAGSTYVYQCSAHSGMVGNIVISKSVNSTTDLNEGSNLYYTNTRVYSNVIGLLNAKANVVDLTTSNVVELNNLYYTNARVYANVVSLLPTYTGNLTSGNISVTGFIFANGIILQGVNVTGSILSGNVVSNASISDTIVANSVTSNIWVRLYTSNVIESGNTTSGNVYFTNTRARAAFISGDNITIEANGRISSSGGAAAATQLAITNSQVISGGNKNYTLASVIDSANTILVAINGVVQIPAVDYTLSGGQGLVFTANTPANAAIEVKYYGYSALNPNVAVISSSSIIPTVDGQTSYLMGANANQAATVMVALDGLIQRPTVDYTVNNTTITMIPAPPAGSNIEVRFFGQEAVALSAAQSTTAYISNSITYAGGSANLNLGSNILLARNIIVTVDGITQIPDYNYTVSGNTLSFGTTVPSINSIVEVKFFGAEAFNANLTQAMVSAVLPAVLSNDTLVRQIIRSSAYAFSRIFY